MSQLQKYWAHNDMMEPELKNLHAIECNSVDQYYRCDEVDARLALMQQRIDELTIQNESMHGAMGGQIALMQRAIEWQPIETAPTDGTPVLVCNSERGGAWIAYYNPVYHSGYRPENPWSSLMLNMHWHNTKLASTAPTHWMPLPAPFIRPAREE